MISGTIDIASRETGSISLPLELVDQFSSRVEGPLLRAGDPGWKGAVDIWNAMAAKTPALVVQPVSARDVAEAVTFAREHGLLLSVKGGGHNIAGSSIAEGGLTLDMSRMRRVVVDPGAGRVDVGPGSLLKEVDRATQEHGRATVLGFVSETGVAGLTLGGGFGYLTRRFGWVVDNLEEVEIVTADGEIRRANREENGDLFWAIRGAGHNFGVVTRFTFRLHEVGPAVTGGLIGWSAERADDVLAAYRELTESGPRELTAAAVIRLAPAAPFVPDEWRWKPMIGILLCHSGPDPEGDLGPLRTLGDPIFDTVGPKPYVVQQSLVDALEPRGFARYWKSEYLPGLTADFLEAFRESALALTSPMSQSLIFQLGGALRDREYDDGAVGNRDAEYTSGFNATWLPNASAEEHVAWARQGWESIRPFSTGGNYVNFQLAEDDVSRTAAAYGKNYTRLERLKAKYDPANVFRVNRNISPAA